jgi:hypothetical protein
MDALTLVLIFSSGIAISGCIVILFGQVLEKALQRVLAAEPASIWTAYAKFAVFVSGLAGGLNASDMETLVAASQNEPVNAARCLLAVLKTAQGTLEGSSWSLLVVLGAAFGGSLAWQLYEAVKESSRQYEKAMKAEPREHRRDERQASLSGQAR